MNCCLGIFTDGVGAWLEEASGQAIELEANLHDLKSNVEKDEVKVYPPFLLFIFNTENKIVLGWVRGIK